MGQELFPPLFPHPLSEQATSPLKILPLSSTSHLHEWVMQSPNQYFESLLHARHRFLVWGDPKRMEWLLSLGKPNPSLLKTPEWLTAELIYRKTCAALSCSHLRPYRFLHLQNPVDLPSTQYPKQEYVSRSYWGHLDNLFLSSPAVSSNSNIFSLTWTKTSANIKIRHFKQ